ncbi:hypothetical protein [Paracoccus cavernae]|uniref:hypothetical protein n=1 Tax=Paracoccus cavernae TaxID=1571207 RepID=UPI0035F234BB
MTWTDPKIWLLAAGFAALTQEAAAREPLSASDWLSGSVQEPDNRSAWRPGDARPKVKGKSKDLARTGSVEPVGVTRLGENNPDTMGTVSPRSAGLPAGLWGDGESRALAAQVARQSPHLPALRRLLRRVLAAQLDPPKAPDPASEGALFLARVDKLLDMGATRAAQDLLLRAGPGDPERFRRLFDIALLSGNEAQACKTMDLTPGIAPSFSARIFCLALGGDWAAASLVHYGAETLGRIDPDTARLLSHFLDDGYIDSAEVLTPPATVTPLIYRLHEAIGQPLPSANLPLAFALFDLDDNGGWKAQIDAAERLARAGAIPASQLREIYLLQEPAASGGVWDRVSAFQTLEEALATRDRDAVEGSLPQAFDAMRQGGLFYALADMVGAETAALAPSGRAGMIAMWLALAADQAQTIETAPVGASAGDQWLIAFATGKAVGPPPVESRETTALLAGAFTGKAGEGLPEQASQLIAANRQGEALLDAVAAVDAGTEGDYIRAAQGLRVLRALGQDDIARQAAVELILGARMADQE